MKTNKKICKIVKMPFRGFKQSRNLKLKNIPSVER